MAKGAPNVLTKRDGQELVQILNAVMKAADETMLHRALYLHYHAGEGWRARFWSGGDDEATKEWVCGPTSGTGLLDALHADVQPILANLAEQDRVLRGATRPVKRRR